MLDCNKKTVKNRIPKILNFMRPLVISENKLFSLHRDTLKSIFGKQNDPLPAALRKEFLIDFNSDSIPGGYSKLYLINRANFLQYEKIFYPKKVASTIAAMTTVRAIADVEEAEEAEIKAAIKAAIASEESNRPAVVNTSPSTVKRNRPVVVTEDEKKQLEGQISWRWKSGRNTVRKSHRFHELRKDARHRLFFDYGYKWDYDISTSAPTLLLQRALKLRSDYSDDLSLPDYILNIYPAMYILMFEKTAIREALAKDLELTTRHRDGYLVWDTDTVKSLLHGLLMGGKIRCSRPKYKSEMGKLLGNDECKIEAAKQNEYIIQLMSEIKQIWHDIYEDEKLKKINMFDALFGEPKKRQSKSFTSKQKMKIYLGLEEMIRNQFISYAKLKKNRIFQIHDGFISDNKVDVSDLSLYIYNETSYSVTFSEDPL